MNPIVRFCFWLIAHIAGSVLARYSSDVEESPRESELWDILRKPGLDDLCGDYLDQKVSFYEMRDYVKDTVIPADRYFVLRSQLNKLRKRNYNELVGLLISVLCFVKAKNAITGELFTNGYLGAAVTAVVFIISYFIARYLYNCGLKLPVFDSKAEDNGVLISHHYSYLFDIEPSIRRRNLVHKIFAVIYFLCFFNPEM